MLCLFYPALLRSLLEDPLPTCPSFNTECHCRALGPRLRLHPYTRQARERRQTETSCTPLLLIRFMGTHRGVTKETPPPLRSPQALAFPAYASDRSSTRQGRVRGRAQNGERMEWAYRGKEDGEGRRRRARRRAKVSQHGARALLVCGEYNSVEEEEEGSGRRRVERRWHTWRNGSRKLHRV